MPVQRISEKEFRTRRRDRRMVWVDALAFLVGLLIVTVSVGGVIFYEETVEPIEWQPVFVEQRMNETRTCIGYDGGDAQGSGCSVPMMQRGAYEGEPWPRDWPELTEANVTEVAFRLSWIADIPRTDVDCDDEENPEEAKYCNRVFHYDRNATVIMRLEVHTPWDEVIVAEGMNNWENVTDGTREGVPSGSVRITVPVLEAPQDVPTVKAHSQEEVEKAMARDHWVRDHDGIGTWRTVVTVLRTTTINGTVPTDVCAAAGQEEGDVPQGSEVCDQYDTYELLFGPGQGGNQGGLPTAYPGFYGYYGEGFFDPVRGLNAYGSSYKSEEQSWVLTKTVRGWQGVAVPL